MAYQSSKKAKAQAKNLEAFRSKLEGKVALLLPDGTAYESTKIPYTSPETKHKYLPDFCLRDNVYIEVKGWLKPSERKKHILIKEQHPEIEIKFFFDNGDKKIYKGSPTSYGAWATANGFEWTDLKRGLPDHWLTKVKAA